MHGANSAALLALQCMVRPEETDFRLKRSQIQKPGVYPALKQTDGDPSWRCEGSGWESAWACSCTGLVQDERICGGQRKRQQLGVTEKPCKNITQSQSYPKRLYCLFKPLMGLPDLPDFLWRQGWASLGI